MDDRLPPSVDQLWAVVVYQQVGGGTRLLWSSAQHTWLPSRRYGHGFVDSRPSGFKGRPYDDDVVTIAQLVTELERYGSCDHCGLTRVEDHFIAPSVFGDAAMHCVQMPSRSIVSSLGGGGTRKHWGSPYGCSAVETEFFTDSCGLVYAHYGQGLAASQVRDWDWCANCTRAAAHVSDTARSKKLSPEKYVQDKEDKIIQAREGAAGRRLGERSEN